MRPAGSCSLHTTAASQLPSAFTAVTSATLDFLGGAAVTIGSKVSGGAAALRARSKAMCIRSEGG